MTENQLPLAGKSRRNSLGFLSSQKVFTAFKSPCRPDSTQNQCSKGATVSAADHRDTPRPFSRKRKTALVSSFVSPLKSKVLRTEVTKDLVYKLKEEIKDQENEIEELHNEGLLESDLQKYIEKLHEYNEIKDVAQMVIGRLAVQLETTTRDVYTKFGLTPED